MAEGNTAQPNCLTGRLAPLVSSNAVARHRKAMDALELKLRQDIDNYGWHVLNVFPGESAPGFSYSVGLFRTLGHPEIVIIGLSPQIRHQLINLVGEKIRGGSHFGDGTISSEILKDYDCIFKEVPLHVYEDFFGRAIDFYQGESFPVLQLVYPDREGLWPWDVAADEGFRLGQLVLAYGPSSGEEVP